MANKSGHRRFGSVRRRRSGRWQARYQGLDGLIRSAPRTFDSKRSAEQWLTLMEGRILRGEWQPPEQSKMMFGGKVGAGFTGAGNSTSRSVSPGRLSWDIRSGASSRWCTPLAIPSG